MFTRRHLAEFVIALAVLGVYCLLVKVSPVMKCGCDPGKERARCRRCKGYGYRYRPGAVAVHRFYWITFGNRQRDKLKEEVEIALEQANKGNGDQS